MWTHVSPLHDSVARAFAYLLFVCALTNPGDVWSSSGHFETGLYFRYRTMRFMSISSVGFMILRAFSLTLNMMLARSSHMYCILPTDFLYTFFRSSSISTKDSVVDFLIALCVPTGLVYSSPSTFTKSRIHLLPLSIHERFLWTSCPGRIYDHAAASNVQRPSSGSISTKWRSCGQFRYINQASSCGIDMDENVRVKFIASEANQTGQEWMMTRVPRIDTTCWCHRLVALQYLYRVLCNSQISHGLTSTPSWSSSDWAYRSRSLSAYCNVQSTSIPTAMWLASRCW